MTEYVLSPAPPRISPSDIRRTITPLRLVFWGGILCVFDLAFSSATNGEGFRFDLLNDAVGVILITVGVFRLATVPVNRRYRRAMRFVQVVSVLVLVDAVREHILVPESPPVVDYFFMLVSLASMIAIVLFCVAMTWLCRESSFLQPWRSWRITTALFVLVYLLPVGGFYAVGLCYVAAGRSFHIDLGPLGLLLLPVFAAPIVHLFISTSRMKRAAEAVEDSNEQQGGAGLRRPVGNALTIVIIAAILAGLALPVLGQMLMHSRAIHRLTIPGLWSRRLEDGIVKLGGTAYVTPTGQAVQISIGSNTFDDVRVVVIEHQSQPVRIEDGQTVRFGFDESLAGMLSNVGVVSRFPADESSSGLWVDGVQRPFSKPLTVIYVSDKYPATEVPIRGSEEEAFLQDARGGRDAHSTGVIEKWILPRLTAPPPSPRSSSP